MTGLLGSCPSVITHESKPLHHHHPTPPPLASVHPLMQTSHKGVPAVDTPLAYAQPGALQHHVPTLYVKVGYSGHSWICGHLLH